jgi:hypothetical protein
MLGELTRDSAKSRLAESACCPALEAFCATPGGAEAVEALTRIAAAKGHVEDGWVCGVCGSAEALHGALGSLFIGCRRHTLEYLRNQAPAVS